MILTENIAGCIEEWCQSFNFDFKHILLGGSDKMQNSDFGPTHKTGGAKHKINYFCFLKFFILMKFDPSQAQKNDI